MTAARLTGTAAGRRAASVQSAVLVISLLFFAWNVLGMIANPDFATGSDATSKVVLGVDYNGWHALSGLLLFGPGILLALRKQWATLFAVTAAGALYATGIWATFDKQPAGVFYFKHNDADAVLHIAAATLYAAAAAYQTVRDRGALASA